VAPVVAWNLLEERATVITTDPAGLTYRSLGGIQLHYTWPEIVGVDEPAAPGRLARLFLDDPVPSAPPTLDQRPAAGLRAAPMDSPNHTPASSPGTNDLAGAPSAAAEEDRDQDAYDDAQRTIPLRVMPPPATRLGGSLLRALWQQAHGATLPLPAGLTDRAALLATIRAHRAPPTSSPPR
jgi:hypothetical protein